MLAYLLLSGGVILSSTIIALLLEKLFKTPTQAFWSGFVIGLCNYMLLAAIVLLFTHFNVFIFCLIVIISMIIFTLITSKVAQISNRVAANIVAIFILFDFLAFIVITKLV